ncbi:hypothetical protein CERZMDRAFT_98093 [Cercospora zeae-maydis SCOH1-5]|uniref:Uncharacterized protein n=1 Tax=Cercospora zeae-maydis SCOH1-5 TaxID=717836 RepID=A0A6A6FE51_9PEZI|nr:hypothetical protein CERZMDRAFT_98093 [Cercospora zeae-maydis SCOH1-5]
MVLDPDLTKAFAELTKAVRDGDSATQSAVNNASASNYNSVLAALKPLDDKLKATVYDPLLTNVGFNQFCAISCPLVKNGEVLPIGRSVGITALFPGAGSVVQTTNNAFMRISDSAHVSLRWLVEIEEIRDAGSQWSEAQPASHIREQNGHFQILSGSLSSPVLELLPWPDASDDGLGSPSAKIRKFRLTLQVRSWWPGIQFAKAAPSAGFEDVGNIIFSVASWQSLLGPMDKEKDAIAVDLSAVDGRSGDFHQLRNLFDIKLDTPAPSLMHPAILSLVPKDGSLDGTHRVESILHAAPDIHFQAALDVGAPVQGVLNSLVKAAQSLFTGSSTEVASQAVTSTALNVSKVLTGAMTIPIAVDFNGQSIAKTLKPIGDLPLPSLARISSTPGIGGMLPIGKLLTAFEMSSSDISAIPEKDGIDKFLVKPLLGDCALSILPVPTLQPSEIPNASTATKFDIKIQSKLTIPGAKNPLTLDINVGSISLISPSIPLPQIMLMFRDDLGNLAQTDILLAVDPITGRRAPSVETLLKELSQLSEIISPLSSIFPDEILNKTLEFDRLLATIAQITTRLQRATNVTVVPTPLPSPGSALRQMFSPDWYQPAVDPKTGRNVSAVLYLGMTELSKYRAFLLVAKESHVEQTDISLVSFGASKLSPVTTSSVVFDAGNKIPSEAYYYSLDKAGPKTLSPSPFFNLLQNWNDRIIGLEWCLRAGDKIPDWQGPDAPQKLFRHIYYQNMSGFTTSVCLFSVETGSLDWEDGIFPLSNAGQFDMAKDPKRLVAGKLYGKRLLE